MSIEEDRTSTKRVPDHSYTPQDRLDILETLMDLGLLLQEGVEKIRQCTLAELEEYTKEYSTVLGDARLKLHNIWVCREWGVSP